MEEWSTSKIITVMGTASVICIIISWSIRA
jgi:hypothetical protein